MARPILVVIDVQERFFNLMDDSDAFRELSKLLR